MVDCVRRLEHCGAVEDQAARALCKELQLAKLSIFFFLEGWRDERPLQHGKIDRGEIFIRREIDDRRVLLVFRRLVDLLRDAIAQNS